MNYFILSVQIVKIFEPLEFPDSISVVELFVKMTDEENTVNQFRVAAWGKLGQEVFTKYKEKDCLLIEGCMYLRVLDRAKEIDFLIQKIQPFISSSVEKKFFN